MPEWIIEDGIGETRAALLEDGEIVEARVRRDGITPAGAIVEAKLIAIAPRVTVEANGERFLLPLGATGVTEGARLIVEVTRETLGGTEPWKLGLARRTDRPLCAAPPLAEGSSGRIDGWDDLLEEARTGIVAFNGGELRIEPTAAMTVIDVDGWLVPDKLAQMAAWAAARAIRRLDIGGSIGIDFPTLKGRAGRAEIDSILDAYLGKPFERTAVNGFGFVQIVRPRRRASLIELAQDQAAFEARALLRRIAAEPPGSKRVVAHPWLIAVLESRPSWLEALGRLIGGGVELRANPALTMSGGHAEPA